jgi:AraC family transcriptional regulator of adaptative response / DNA-3-methyladenine glycosylase II
MITHINVTQPYNWAMVQAFLSRRAIAGVETCGPLSYARYFDERPFYAVTANHSASANDCQALGQPSSWFCATYEPDLARFRVELQLHKAECADAVIANITRVLDAHQEMPVITEALLNAGFAANELTPGIRLPATWSPFEALIRAIVGQQISVTGAVNILNRWVGDIRSEEAVASIGATSHALQQFHFPTPDEIAKYDTSSLPMPKARQQTLNVAGSFAQNNALLDVDNVQALLALKGIGPWTVNYVLMRGLSAPDVFLHNDLVVKNQLKRFTIDPQHAAPWQSYVCIQLWEHANT